MKAFLSHSSKDREFVDVVAEELGRQFTWLARDEFTTGDELFRGLEIGLADSGVFVLFATRAALRSAFVGFEVSEARSRLVAGALDRVMVFLLEAGMTPADLPSWLQRAHVTSANAPRPVARAIRVAIDSLVAHRQGSLFVGRTRELAALQGKLLPTDGSQPPRILYVAGLPGIGRRTVLRRVARDHWSLSRNVGIPVEPADDLPDLVVKLADHFEAYNTLAAFRLISTTIRAESAAKLKARISAYVGSAVRSHELVCFLDEGGLLTNEGLLSDLAMLVIQVIQASPALYAAFISTRRPAGLTPLSRPALADSLLPALTDVEGRQLVAALIGRAGLTLSGDKISALAEASAGYPPSAYQITELVKQYGADVALADIARLSSSRYGPLATYLKRIDLQPLQRELLRLLATISPLPLPVLGSVLAISPKELAEALVQLIDVSLLTVDEEGEYWIAKPVADLVVREWGEISKDSYAGVADALDEYIRELGEDVPRLAMTRALHRAHLLADDTSHREAAFVFLSDVLRVAERMYHRRDYRRAIDYAKEVKAGRPRNYDARFLLGRALIKSGEFGAAEAEIEELRRMSYLRETAFLSGFLERHSGRPREAIAHYESALRRGYGGLSIHREMAQCFIALDDLPAAKEHLRKASRFGGDNRFVIDLQVVIAAKERDEATANLKLAQLEILDEPAFYYHRLSTVRSAFGRTAEALSAARMALNEAGRPTFAMLAQLVVAETRAGELSSAENHLHQLDREFPNQSKDVRIGLRVQLEIAHGRCEDALIAWQALSDKRRPVHLALKSRAIEGLLGGALRDEHRFELEAELRELQSALARFGNVEFEPLLD